MTEPEKEQFMREAIQLSLQNVASKQGGPFGAVITRQGEILARGVNLVTASLDPTAHAEVVAIREACGVVRDFQLTGCEIFCSCEPCPMCLGAIYWARLDAIYFANSKSDAAEIDFDDHLIYQEIARPFSDRNVVTQQLLRDEAILAFQNWAANPENVKY